MTVKGHCRTNLDGYETVRWPDEFVAVPLKGERVLSMDGRCSLKVVGITHCRYEGRDPFIEVELHKEIG